MRSTDLDRFKLTALALMRIACWPIEFGGEETEQSIVWVAEEECEEEGIFFFRFMRFHPLRLFFGTDNCRIN
jgi:hypothetical protein